MGTWRMEKGAAQFLSNYHFITKGCGANKRTPPTMLARQTQLGMREIGQRVTIPSDPTAHLAYYLKCMTSLLGDELHTNIERLTDYANYRRLDDSDIDALIVLCIALSPDKLNGKCMFQNDEMCQSDSNKFFELTAVQSTLAVAQEVMVAGRSTTVRKIMTYKMCWIEEHFLQPPPARGWSTVTCG